MLTKNAIGNMQNRYIAVLKKCRLLNTFGSAAMVAMLTLGSCGGLVVESCCDLVQDACAADLTINTDATISTTESYEHVSIETTGKLTIGNGGNVSANNNGLTTISGSLTVENGGTYTSEGATILSYQTSASLTVKDGGTYNAGSITSINDTTTLTIESGGIYNASDTILNGGTLINNGEITTTGFAVSGGSSITSLNTGSSLTIADSNSSWTQDPNDSVAQDITYAKLTSSNYAILAISSGSSLYVESDTLTVGTLANGATASGTTFCSDSLLVIDASAYDGGDYALTASTISVESGASLLVCNADFSNGDTTTVYIAKATALTANSLSIADGAWGYDADIATASTDDEYVITGTSTISEASNNNLYFDNAFISGEVAFNYYNQDGSGGYYFLTLTKLDSGTVLPLLDRDLADHINDASTLPTYVKDASLISDKKKAAATIEGAAKLSVGAGVLASLSAVNELGASAVANRSNLVATSVNNSTISQLPVFLAASDTSFTDTPMPVIADAATEGGLVDGFAIWLQPLYQSVSADGFKSGNFEYGYDTDIFGVSLGADYTMDKSLRFGLAFHMGSGDTESSNSDFSHTENDFDYFGATIYGAYIMNNFSLAADMGYLVTTNDVIQKSSVGELSTGDFDAGAFSLGLRAQYKIESLVDIIPYLGARLNYAHIESFNTKDANGTVFHNESAEATTFGIPVGINLAKTMDFDGFTLTPRAKVGVQFTMGDLDVEQRVSLPNTSGHATMESEVFDPVTFMGGVGLDAVFDDVTLALEYNLGASENVTSHQVMATLSYRF